MAVKGGILILWDIENARKPDGMNISEAVQIIRKMTYELDNCRCGSSHRGADLGFHVACTEGVLGPKDIESLQGVDAKWYSVPGKARQTAGNKMHEAEQKLNEVMCDKLKDHINTDKSPTHVVIVSSDCDIHHLLLNPLKIVPSVRRVDILYSGSAATKSAWLTGLQRHDTYNCEDYFQAIVYAMLQLMAHGAKRDLVFSYPSGKVKGMYGTNTGGHSNGNARHTSHRQGGTSGAHARNSTSDSSAHYSSPPPRRSSASGAYEQGSRSTATPQGTQKKSKRSSPVRQHSQPTAQQAQPTPQPHLGKHVPEGWDIAKLKSEVERYITQLGVAHRRCYSMEACWGPTNQLDSLLLEFPDEKLGRVALLGMEHINCGGCHLYAVHDDDRFRHVIKLFVIDPEIATDKYMAALVRCASGCFPTTWNTENVLDKAAELILQRVPWKNPEVLRADPGSRITAIQSPDGPYLAFLVHMLKREHAELVVSKMQGYQHPTDDVVCIASLASADVCGQ